MALDQDTSVRLLMRDSDKLRAYAWMILRDDHLVEDALQELGLVVVKKCGEINDEAHFGAWCRIATRNIARNLVSQRERHPTSMSEDLLDALESQWQELDQSASADVMNALRHCIGKLGDYGRQLLKLRYADGLRSAQMAEQLNRNVKTVYVALTRTHKTLASCIERQLRRGGSDE